MKRSTGLSSKSTLKRSGPIKPRERPVYKSDDTRRLPSFEEQKAALKKSTLRLLEKARNEAKAKGVDLTEWEGEFIEGVSERVQTYGRAFADPDKGAMNGTLSLRQGLKLREIRKKIRAQPSPKAPDEGLTE